jgi:hypothetical protein
VAIRAAGSAIDASVAHPVASRGSHQRPVDEPAADRRGQVHRGGGVEPLVTGGTAPPVPDLLLHERQGLVDLGEVVVVAPVRGQSGELDLHRLARLDDLLESTPTSTQGADHLPAGRDVEDHGAVTVPDVDDALHLQCDQRLAHRRPADLQSCGEIPLGG